MSNGVPFGHRRHKTQRCPVCNKALKPGDKPLADHQRDFHGRKFNKAPKGGMT